MTSNKQASPIATSQHHGSDSPSPRPTLQGPGLLDSTPAPAARSRQRQAQLAKLEEEWDVLNNSVTDLAEAGARAEKHERHSMYLAVRAERALVAEELAELKAILSSPPRSREMESGLSNAAPAPAATRPAQLRYKEYPVHDSRFTRLDKTVADFTRWFARLAAELLRHVCPRLPPRRVRPGQDAVEGSGAGPGDRHPCRQLLQVVGRQPLHGNVGGCGYVGFSRACYPGGTRVRSNSLPC